MGASLEIAKKQAEFVRNKLREMDELTGAKCARLVIADYDKAEFEKIRPKDDWAEYIEQRFMFTTELSLLNILTAVHFQSIDYAGFVKFCEEQKCENNEAARAAYANFKYGKECCEK